MDIHITQDLQEDNVIYIYMYIYIYVYIYIYIYILHTIFRKIKVYALRTTRVDIYITQDLQKDKGTYIYIYIYIYVSHDFQKDKGMCIG